MRSSPLRRQAQRFGRRHSQPSIEFPCSAPQRDGKFHKTTGNPANVGIFHFSGSLVFSLTFQVGTPASINASSNRFPASIKAAGGVQSPEGSGFHSVSAKRPPKGEPIVPRFDNRHLP